MKRILIFGLAAGLLLACLAGCGAQQSTIGGQAVPASSALEAPSGQEPAPSPSSAPNGGTSSGEISREEVLAIALDNAGVPEGDAYNIKNETDRDHGIPIYDIEFETEYGDYDFEIAIDGGRIVGADYEVDEEWLNTLSGSPVSMEEATEIVAGPGRQPGEPGGGRRSRGGQGPRLQRRRCDHLGGIRGWPGPVRGGTVL